MVFSLQQPTGDFEERIGQQIRAHSEKLVRAGRGRMFFHLFFALLLTAELLLFYLFFASFSQAAWVSLLLGLIFLTSFAYLILRLFFHSRAAEIQEELAGRFLERCRELYRGELKKTEGHIAIANACTRFACRLKGLEHRFYRGLPWSRALRGAAERFSAFCHAEEVRSMRERLLRCSIREHLELVKLEPTRPEFHSALANAYIVLSGLYRSSETEKRLGEPKKRELPALRRKFRETAKRAIEEFKILNEYAPDDPWVHRQLAYSYRDLHMPKEEIREYEILLQLKPDDAEILFKLGSLYLQQGKNALGLKIYQTLKTLDERKAEEMIRFYGLH